MTAITFGGLADAPTNNGDSDVWGLKIRDGWAKIYDDLEMLNTTSGITFLGKSTSGSGEVERLTMTQALSILPAVGAASQGSAGTKGVVPQPPAASQNKPLCGDGTFKAGIGRFAGGCITVSSGTATLSGALNCSASSAVVVSPSLHYVTITMTNGYGSTEYALATGSSVGIVQIDNRTSSTFRVYYNPASDPRVDFSVF